VRDTSFCGMSSHVVSQAYSARWRVPLPSSHLVLGVFVLPSRSPLAFLIWIPALICPVPAFAACPSSCLRAVFLVSLGHVFIPYFFRTYVSHTPGYTPRAILHKYPSFLSSACSACASLLLKCSSYTLYRFPLNVLNVPADGLYVAGVISIHLFTLSGRKCPASR
jgi:hypothetical protein